MKLWANCGTNSVTFFLARKNPSTTSRTKSLQAWRFGQKFFGKIKKPWPQTNNRRSLARLAWQSRSPGYFIDLLRYIGFRPTTSAGTFPTVRIHSSVIWSVSACLCFYSTTFPRVLQQKLPLVNPNKTATNVDSLAHFVTFTGPFRTFRLCYGGRAAWSVKGAQQFWCS